MSKSYPIAKLRRAMLHFFGGRAVQALARAGLVLLVVRLLPASDYGAYMLIVGVSEMLLQLCSFGILPVGQRFLPQIIDAASLRDTCRFLAIMASLQFLALAVICSLFWVFWGDMLPWLGFSAEQIERTRPAVLLFLLVPAFRFVADLLEALLEQGKAQVARALMPLGRVLGIGGLLAFGLDVSLERIIMVDGSVTLGCLGLAWILMVATLAGKTDPPDPQPLPVPAMLRHARHMAAVDFLGSAQAPGAMRLVLANALGIVESGLFAFLQSLQRLVGRYLPGVLLRGLVRPMLISRANKANGMQLLEGSMGLLLKSNLLIVAGAVVVVVFGGDRIVAVASGGRFPEAGDTLLLMLLALAVTSQRQVIEMLMQVLNQTHVLWLTAMLAPVTLAAVWLCAGFGLNVAIAVSAVGVALVNAINMWRLRAHTGRFRLDWWGSAAIVLPAGVAALVGQAVRGALGFWVAIAIAAAVLAALLAVAKPFANGELEVARRAIGSLAGRALQPFSRKAVL